MLGYRAVHGTHPIRSNSDCFEVRIMLHAVDYMLLLSYVDSFMRWVGCMLNSGESSMQSLLLECRTQDQVRLM